MKIRKFKASDSKRVAFIIRNTFAHFNRKEGTKSAVDKYINFYDPKSRGLNKIVEGFTQTHIFYVAVEKNQLIGMVRGNEKRAVNLFVLGEYHRRGVGRRLMEYFEADAKKRGSHEIKIRASLYAAPFYESLGYKKTTGIRTSPRLFNLKYQPMRKELK